MTAFFLIFFAAYLQGFFTTTAATVRSQGIQCSGEVKLSSSDRAAILNEHNQYRSDIARGVAIRHNGLPPIPRGKNIYQLAWDCDLEVQSQKWAEKCKLELSSEESRNAGEWVYQFTSTKLHNDIFLRYAFEMYRMEVENWIGIPEVENILDDTVNYYAGRWAQIVWGKTTKLGCGVANCKNTTTVVCRYRESSQLNEKIYELGDGCSENSDCTTYAGSTCNVESSLCVAPNLTAEGKPAIISTTTTQATKTPELSTALPAADVNCIGGSLSNSDRAAVLKKHNDYRSALVRGNAGYGAPGGKNVHQLDYDCELEKTAQQWADTCPLLTHSEMADLGENIFYSSDKSSSIKYHLLSASTMWWDELKDNGYIGNVFYSPFSGEKGTLGHWSQMAWGRTSKLGCGFATCDYGVSVVCHYLEAGNFLGATIYETGANGCNQDSDCRSKKCNASNGLCILTGPLCEDEASNCKALEDYCNDPWNPHIAEKCPATCGKC